MFQKIINKLSLPFALSIVFLVAIRVEAQQLRDIVRQVDASVVVVKTVEKNLLPAPQPMFVSSPGLGSGVLISIDGKILTAAHVVQAADKIEVEFVDGQVAPAKVIASVPGADVAMLKLDWVPANAQPAKLGDSDQVQVGDDVFIIGAPYGVTHSLSVGHVSAKRRPKKIGGDIILSVGGIAVSTDGSSASSIMDYFNRLKPGEEVTVSVLRAGQITKLKTFVRATF